MTDDQEQDVVRYTYKASVAGSPQMFELTEEGLAFQTGFRSAVWRYADIARIRLTYRPVSMLRHRFRADIRHKDGRTLKVISATWTGIVVMTPQSDAYRTFIEALHRRVAAEGGIVCVGGLPPVMFAAAALVCAALMVALAMLFVRALATGGLVAAAFLAGFAAWSAWYIGGWLMRNKPQRYEAQAIPPQLLP